MAKTRIDDPHIKALFAEVAATKLLLRIVIERSLSADQDKAWQEIEAIVRRIEEIAANSVVGATTDQSSRQLVDTARDIAVNFVLPLGPKSTKQ